MKNILYLLLAFFITTAATCKKNQFPVLAFEKQLIGKWQYTGRTGGFAGKSEQAAPNEIQILEFKKGMTFVRSINGQSRQTGTYEITAEKSIYSGKEEPAIRFNQQTDQAPMGHIISIKDRTLTMADNVYDGFTTTYTRSN